MKHLPNILTLGNLFCGCIAIYFTLSANPFLVQNGEDQYWIAGTTMAYYGAIFIGIAGIFDLLDGAVARALHLTSTIGKDLDSLADIVSFGVAPSMILAKMLWASSMSSANAMDVSLVAVIPAFILACFGALRLAMFNNLPENNYSFTGVPIPAIGITVASFPLISYFNSFGLAHLMNNYWFLLAIIALFSWLMVSKFQLFTLKIKSLNLQENWGRYLWLVVSVLLIPFLKFAAVPVSFLLYIIISIFYKPNFTKTTHE